MLKRSLISGIFAAALLATPVVLAQTAPKAPVKKADQAALFAALPIGVVNLQRVTAESKVHQDIFRQHNAVLEKYRAEVQKIEKELKKNEEEVRAQKSILSPSEFEKKAQEFNQSVMEKQGEVQQKERDMRRVLDAAFRKLDIDHIFPVLENVVSGNGLRFLFQSQNVLVFNSDFEVTDEIISKLNARTTSMKLLTEAEVNDMEKKAEAAQKAAQAPAKKK